jgi:HK97 gp10 family phage protein
MPGKVTVTVRGVEELRRDLNRLSVAVGDRLINNAARAGARVVVRAAKVKAPVETGELQKSLRVRRRTADERKRGEVVAYAGTSLFYARFYELGTSRQPARPFLRPAADESHAEIFRTIQESLSRGIDREIAKQPVPLDVSD